MEAKQVNYDSIIADNDTVRCCPMSARDSPALRNNLLTKSCAHDMRMQRFACRQLLTSDRKRAINSCAMERKIVRNMKVVIDAIGLGKVFRLSVRLCVLIKPAPIARVIASASLTRFHRQCSNTTCTSTLVKKTTTLNWHLIDNTREFITCKCHFWFLASPRNSFAQEMSFVYFCVSLLCGFHSPLFFLFADINKQWKFY